MDAVKYIKERRRMCEKYSTCGDCPLKEIREGTTCGFAIKTHPEEAVAIVGKWSREHPLMTNGDKIMELAEYAAKLANEYTVSLHFDRQWWDAEYKEERDD